MRISVSRTECKVDASAASNEKDFRIQLWDSCPDKGYLTVHYPGKTISLTIKQLRALLKQNEELFADQ